MKYPAREYLEQDEEFKMPLKHLDEINEKQDLSYAEWARRRDLQMWKMERHSILEDGRKEGKAEGIAEGKEQNQKEIALRMLETGYAPSEISKLTSLLEQEIARLNGHLSARS